MIINKIRVVLALLALTLSPAFSGTANCDADSDCESLKCNSNEKPYCDIIQGTTGPRGRSMGFCKCELM